MANVDRADGFKPYKRLDGLGWNGAYVKCFATDDLFMGDAVTKKAAGIASGDGAFQSVARATDLTGQIYFGVVVGWEADPTNLENLYHVGSGAFAVYICSDPDMTYLIQGDEDGSNAVTHTDVGLNIDGLVASGDTVTGLSNMEVDQSVTGITTVAGLHLIGIPDLPGQDITLDNTQYQVMFALTTYKNAGAVWTVGV